MKKPTLKKITFPRVDLKELIFFIAVIALMGCIITFGLCNKSTYTQVNNKNLNYEKATVVAIDSENITQNYENINQGVQQISVLINSGPHKGETIDIKNILSYEHSILVKTNQNIIVCIDQATSDYYTTTVYNYDRTLPIIIAVLIFLVALIAVAGFKGLRSAFGLVFTFIMIIFFMIPIIALGLNPIIACLVTVIPIVVVCLLALTGLTRQSLIAIAATVIGVVVAALIFTALSFAFHISGYNLTDVDTLVVIAQSSKLQIRDLLFVGIIISTLGAMMDISISIVSSICEIHYNKPDLTVKELFRSGMKIGKDVIGTMTTTLILAFTGSFFVTMFLFYIYSINSAQFMNMDIIAIELAQALAGSIALILSLPLTAYLAAKYAVKHSEKIQKK